MPNLIKNGELSVDNWQFFESDTFDDDTLANGFWVLPLDIFLAAFKQQKIDFQRFAVYLKSDDDVGQLAQFVNQLQLIALKFTAFTDGRSFSQARTLRDQLDYNGEIRAIGAFLQDQLFYLSRCGVNAFLLADRVNVESAVASLCDFSDNYQAACDEPQPLFRRRV